MTTSVAGLTHDDIASIRDRRPFAGHVVTGYLSKGGTYIIANRGIWNDNGKPRDLVVILPGDLGSGRVIPLYIAVNPEFIAELEAIFP